MRLGGGSCAGHSGLMDSIAFARAIEMEFGVRRLSFELKMIPFLFLQ